MGIILSRFRRKKTTDEILEEIQNDIQALEENRDQTLQRQKYWIGRLYIYSITVYVLIAAIFYFCFFPASLADRVFYIIPLIGFPIIVFLLKKIINWYYKREIILSKDKLADLKAKKKKILEDVMNKETYKIAKEILEKYAPEQIRKSSDTSPKLVHSSSMSPQKVQRQPPPQQQLIKGPGPPAPYPPAGMNTPQKPTGPMVLQRHPSPQRRLVRPIIPRERSFIDKIIESLVGDGPSNRYALICRNCASHNGMALKEEFEYIAFRCAYCGFPNPAHKVRPRPSVLIRDRTPSEDRRSVDDSSKGETTDNEDKVTDEENKGSESTSSEEKKTEDKVEVVGEAGSCEEVEKPSGSAGNSSDESTTPSDGVRSRKPLHLADD